MTARVVVAGGGYAGLAVARALDEHAEVIVVEPRDRFIHTVGMLRALVDPDFAAQVALSFDSVLRRGTVVQDRVVAVRHHQVDLASGGSMEADFVVLATGSSYPFPAKPHSDLAAQTIADLDGSRAAVERADRVLLLGAGPVGIELAGEIAGVWPGKRIILLDSAPDILGGPYSEELRDALRRQLEALEIDLVVGDGLRGMPSTRPATYAPTVVTTWSGRVVEAEVWFACFGGRPVTDYLVDGLEQVVGADGRIRVGPDLRVPGHPWLYAVGDANDVPEPKRAGVSFGHADVVRTNVLAGVAGRLESTTYTIPETRIVIPLGRRLGAGQVGGQLVGADAVSAAKGADLDLSRTADRFGLALAVSP